VERRPALLALISCSCAVGSLSSGSVGFAVDFHGVLVGLPKTSVIEGWKSSFSFALITIVSLGFLLTFPCLLSSLLVLYRRCLRL
jgi:hypothetical protein